MKHLEELHKWAIESAEAGESPETAKLIADILEERKTGETSSLSRSLGFGVLLSAARMIQTAVEAHEAEFHA